MSGVVELTLPARPDVLALARLVVAAMASTEPSFDDERIDDLRLAVSEACTNAIEAQERAGNASTSRILVRCLVADGRADIEVHDHGNGFDPANIPVHPEVTDPARLDHERGLGIALIRLLSDKVEYLTTDDGTTVAMTFSARPFDGDQP